MRSMGKENCRIVQSTKPASPESKVTRFSFTAGRFYQNASAIIKVQAILWEIFGFPRQPGWRGNLAKNAGAIRGERCVLLVAGY